MEFSQMREVPDNLAGYFYTIVLAKVIEILDIVFASEIVISSVPYELNEEYEKLTNLLQSIKERKDLSLPDTEIRAFSTLHTDFKEKSVEWRLMRDLFVSDVTILSKIFGDPNPPYKHQPPLDLEKSFREIDEMLSQYKSDRDVLEGRIHPHDWEKSTGLLKYKDCELTFSPNSKIHAVYALLEENFTHKASLSDLNKITGSKNQTTKTIADIRSRFKDSGLSQYLSIESTGFGGYSLKLK